MYEAKLKHFIKAGTYKSSGYRDTMVRVACEVWSDTYDYNNLMLRPAREVAEVVRRMERDLLIEYKEDGTPSNVADTLVTLASPPDGDPELWVDEPKGSTFLIQHNNIFRERLLIIMDLTHRPESYIEDLWMGDCESIMFVYNNFLV